MASYFTHGIFDPLSCTGTQWIVDKVMLEHSLHSVLICDIPTVRFQLDCSRAAVCPCTVFRVRCRPHSEGCAVGGKGSVTHLITEVFVEEFMALPVSAKYRMVGKSCVS